MQKINPQDFNEFNDPTIINMLELLNNKVYPREEKIYIPRTKEYLTTEEVLKKIKTKSRHYYFYIEALFDYIQSLPNKRQEANVIAQTMIRRLLVLHQQKTYDLKMENKMLKERIKIEQQKQKLLADRADDMRIIKTLLQEQIKITKSLKPKPLPKPKPEPEQKDEEEEDGEFAG